MIRTTPSAFASFPRAAITLALCALLGACAVGPDYQRPALDVGAAYKEGEVEVPGWKPAQPDRIRPARVRAESAAFVMPPRYSRSGP